MPDVPNSEYEVEWDLTVRGIAYTPGAKLKYTCDQDYVTQHSKVYCDEKGNWLPHVECVPSEI